MLTQIGTKACNAVFDESYCKEFSWVYLVAAGVLSVAVYERERVTDFVLNLLSRQTETPNIVVRDRALSAFYKGK